MRVLFAFVIVPALLPLAYLAYLAATIGRGTPEADIVVSIALPLSYAAVCGLGWPTQLLLRRVHAGGLATYMLWGLGLAIVAYAAYFDALVANWRLWLGAVDGRIAVPLGHVLGDPAIWWIEGAATGMLFWLVAGPGEDRQSKSGLQDVLASGMHRSAQ
ncbi:MAG: hypothetical protein WDN69_35225 [Aliidongia sp.]